MLWHIYYYNACFYTTIGVHIPWQIKWHIIREKGLTTIRVNSLSIIRRSGETRIPFLLLFFLLTHLRVQRPFLHTQRQKSFEPFALSWLFILHLLPWKPEFTDTTYSFLTTVHFPVNPLSLIQSSSSTFLFVFAIPFSRLPFLWLSASGA